MFGVTQADPNRDGSNMLIGGYRITVEDAPSNAFVYAEVKSVSHQKSFRANTANATLVDIPSPTVSANLTQAGLRYKTRDGRWFPANRGPVEHDLLNRIVTAARASKSVDVFVPGFDPRASVATAVDLVLDAPQGSLVGVYSPGTQSHWGTKGDLRAEYDRYGLSPKMGIVDEAMPLHTIISHTSISEGSLRESSSESQLVFSKDADELLSGPQLDYLVVNHLSRAIDEERSTLKKFASRWPDTPIVTLWSPLTKCEGQGVPTYGPPFDLDEPMLTPHTGRDYSDVDVHDTSRARASYDPSESTETLPAPATTTDFSRLSADRTVRFERLDAPLVSELLEDVFSEWQNLSDAGSEDGSRLIFNALMFFHRLPLPREYYDDIIQQRAYDGEIYLPKTGDDHIEDITSYSPDGDYSLLHAEKTLEGVQYELQDNNPMFERLVEYTTQARDQQFKVAILVNSITTSDLLERALCRELSIDDLGDQVYVTSLDSARDIPSVDQLVVCGPQRPNFSSFYLHPRASETTVLTYTDWGERMVDRHVRDYTSNLDALLSEDVEVTVAGDPDELDTGEATPYVEETNAGESRDEPVDTGQSTGVPGDLTEKDLDRLRTIAELQPTKNRELCDRWGYDSGSEVYHYLSSNLGQYYARDDNYLIVLSEEGESILQSLNYSIDG